MKTKTILIIVIIILFALAAALYFSRDRGSIPVPEMPGTEDGTPISISKEEISEENWSGSRPVIEGSGALPDAARAYVDQQITEFRNLANEQVPEMRAEFGVDSPPATYTFDMEASYVRGETTESIVISQYMYTGGANGSSAYQTFSASLESGRLITLADIIRSDRRDDFAAFVRARLMVWRPYGNDSVQFFPEEVGGLGFSALSDWSMDDENLTLYFDEYEIGPGALGAVAFPLPLYDVSAYLASVPSQTAEGIEGCYVSRLAKDVYTLRIENEQNGNVTGFLSFKNFEKDSSSGPFEGTYEDGILLGDYSFTSEGMFSVRQVIFKKTGDAFVEGFGPVDVDGNRERLLDPKTVTYDSKLTFNKEACPAD